VGHFQADPTLPSLVRRPTACGSVVSSVMCGTRRRCRFHEESRPPFAGRLGFHPEEVRSVRLLQAASFFGGCGVRGLIGFPLGVVRLPFRRTGRWRLCGWVRAGCRWADGLGGHRRWLLVVLLRVFGCRAWLVVVVVIVWSVKHGSIGKRSCGRDAPPVRRWRYLVVRSRWSCSSCLPPRCPIVIVFFFFGLAIVSLVRWNFTCRSLVPYCEFVSHFHICR
jgi:hypothetical protein